MTDFSTFPPPDDAALSPAFAADVLPTDPPRRRRSLQVAALVVVIALVAGVGIWVATRDAGSPSSTLVITDLASASRAAAAQGSSTFEMTQTITGPGGSFSFSMHGKSDFDSGTGAVTLDLGEAGKTAGINGLELRTSGSTTYLRVPDRQVAGNGGRHWVSTALTPGSGSNDPSQFLDYLTSANGKPERVGSEQVRGVATTRYRATLAVDAMLDKVPAEMRQQMATAMSQTGITSFPIEVWLDDDDLPRRVETRLSIEGMETVARIEMFDFGKPVDVEVPSRADTRPVATIGELYAAAGLPPGIFG